MLLYSSKSVVINKKIKMQKQFIIIGSLLGALAVILGAFGAHSLKSVIPDQIDTFHTGVQYHFYHTIAIFVVVSLFGKLPEKALKVAGRMFIIGIICFSGSLYLLSCKELLGINTSILGPITPIGGTFFIIGWSILLWNAFKMEKN
jgi:uncharacterized membrane protein YgdD (TMEM256/DUF423 family)